MEFSSTNYRIRFFRTNGSILAIMAILVLQGVHFQSFSQLFKPDTAAKRLAVEMDRKYIELFRSSLQWIKNADTVSSRMYFRNPVYTKRGTIPVNFSTDYTNLKYIPTFSWKHTTPENYTVTFPGCWKDSLSTDITWQLWYQSLVWLQPWIKSPDTDSVRVGYLVLNDWIRQHVRHPEKGEDQTWADHAPAERALVLTEALQKFIKSGYDDPETLRNLRLAVLSHLFFLSTLDRYFSYHNHAIIFNEKMIRSLIRLSGISGRKEMLNLAFTRLFEEYRYSYTREGVHKEHSPCYHLTFSNMLDKMIYHAEKQHIKVPDDIRKIRDKSFQFTDFIRMMGANFPVGDCAREKFNDNFMADFEKAPVLNPHKLKYTYGNFPESGWFFAIDTLYKIRFSAQSDFYSMSHYQRDETSLVLTAGNNELLIDPGLYTYLNSTVFDYYRSSRAHNMLVADGLPDVFDTSMTCLAGITRSFVRKHHHRAACEMINPQYRKFGLDIYRQFIFPGKNSILIRDKMVGNDSMTFRQLFHLWPGAKIEEQNRRILISWKHHDYTLTLISNYESYNIKEGTLDPEQGWYFPVFNSRESAPVIEFVRKGGGIPIETLIVIGSSGDKTREMEDPWKEIRTMIAELEAIPVVKPEHCPYPERWRPNRRLAAKK